MDTVDLNQIEAELSLQLPPHYVSFISNYNAPGHIFKNFIYTDSEHLIHLNKLIGFYADGKSIKRRLIIGDNGGGDFYLINLKDSTDHRVYYYDHEESVDESYDEESGNWDWDSFESSANLSTHLDDLRQLFGTEE